MFVGFMLILLFGLASCAGKGHRIHQEELEKYRPLESFVELKGGEFFMGINDREGVNGEYPPRKAIVQPFRIHLYPVTIASFKKYKNDKFKHKTDAEQAGISWVFDRLVDPTAELDHHVRDDENDPDCKEARNMSMVRVREARWNRPEGGNSSIYHRLNLPVVHVSYNDAFAYCAWMHMRLPTEIEWEYAARGGLQEKLYPWGDKWQVGRSNLWQGRFPVENQERDKFYGLSPVDAYSAQNDYEMHDVLGNVWEWTSTIYRREIKKKDNQESELSGDRRVLKGGSFMDNRDGENRPDRAKIRISARTGRLRTYSAQNVGFRCVQTIQPNEKGVDFNKSSFNVVKLRAPKKFVPHDDL